MPNLKDIAKNSKDFDQFNRTINPDDLLDKLYRDFERPADHARHTKHRKRRSMKELASDSFQFGDFIQRVEEEY